VDRNPRNLSPVVTGSLVLRFDLVQVNGFGKVAQYPLLLLRVLERDQEPGSQRVAGLGKPLRATAFLR
jgi:hypothetical protein